MQPTNEIKLFYFINFLYLHLVIYNWNEITTPIKISIVITNKINKNVCLNLIKVKQTENISQNYSDLLK